VVERLLHDAIRAPTMIVDSLGGICPFLAMIMKQPEPSVAG
jgi:hypothetical protein